jgi:hypothetical protein
MAGEVIELDFTLIVLPGRKGIAYLLWHCTLLSSRCHMQDLLATNSIHHRFTYKQQ